jgi:uncharacterized surface protein with fasciclin (FAS1) repeats
LYKKTNKMINLFKTNLKNAAIGFGIISLAFMGSCSKNNVPPNKSQTITDLVSANANLSFLKAAVVKAGLATTLSGTGPFTVFAPDNSAFIAAGFPNEAAVSAAPAATLKAILLYHVLPANDPSGAIPQAVNTPVTTASNQTVYVTKTSTGAVFVNGASVTTANIKASNGVVHIINAVLTVPAGDIVATAEANPNLSYLVAAVVQANLATTLSGTGPFTVFAPTNQAFINAGFPTIASIQATPAATLASILTYHVIAGRIYSSDLVNNSTPQTVNGENVTILLSNSGAQVKGASNSTASNIGPANITTTNGVVHVINQVLLP